MYILLIRCSRNIKIKNVTIVWDHFVIAGMTVESGGQMFAKPFPHTVTSVATDLPSSTLPVVITQLCLWPLPLWSLAWSGSAAVVEVKDR
jgi:hypothetical protein